MDDVKYAVYLVIVEDSNESFEAMADVVAQYEDVDTDLSWDEAEELASSLRSLDRAARDF
jgi:hypothetical protein